MSVIAWYSTSAEILVNFWTDLHAPLHYSPPVTTRVAAVAPPKSHNLIHHSHQRNLTSRYIIIVRKCVSCIYLHTPLDSATALWLVTLACWRIWLPAIAGWSARCTDVYGQLRAWFWSLAHREYSSCCYCRSCNVNVQEMNLFAVDKCFSGTFSSLTGLHKVHNAQEKTVTAFLCIKWIGRTVGPQYGIRKFVIRHVRSMKVINNYQILKKWGANFRFLFSQLLGHPTIVRRSYVLPLSFL